MSALSAAIMLSRSPICGTLLNGTRKLATTSSLFSLSELAKELPFGYKKSPPFALFVKENFAKKEGEKATAVMIRLKDQWKSLNAEAKKKYMDMSDKQLKENLKKFEALSPEEKQRLRDESKKASRQRKLRRERRERSRVKSEAGIPPKPPSAYNLFIKEKLSHPAKSKEVSYPTLFKEAASSWKTLPAAEKQKYVEEAKVAAEEYRKKMAPQI